MSTIVLIADRDDPKRGEIVTLDDVSEAERLIAGLLDEGCEGDRLRVFGGSELDLRITQRPVVALTEDDAEDLQAAEANEIPEVEKPRDTAFMRDGIRFSSLFKNA